MSLKKLLQEISAAEQAKQKGYVSAGYDKWADQSGKIVARTVDDKLVPVSSDEPTEKPTEPDIKPTGMSAKDAGTTPSNVPQAHDVAQTAGALTSNAASANPQGAPAVPPFTPKNPYQPKPFKFGRPVEDIDIAGEIPPAFDKSGLTRTIHPEEETILCSENDMNEFFAVSEHLNLSLPSKTILRMASENAIQQHFEWRRDLPENVQNELLKVQNWWQKDSQYFTRNSERAQENNAFLTLLGSNKKNPPVLKNVNSPLERGMTISSNKIEEFLKAFTIGDSIELPPSGFSAAPLVARDFALPAVPNLHVGVLMRLSPNKNGELHGIALHGLEAIQSHPEADYRNYTSINEATTYDGEYEVIRTPGPKARCTGIQKLIRVPDPTIHSNVMVVYVVDLEDEGFEPDDADLTLESFKKRKQKKQPNPVFMQIMNTSLHDCVPHNDSTPETLGEGKASELAHKIGLEYGGYGYWLKNGEVVAKTVDDNLVKVSDKDKDIHKNKVTNLGKGNLDKTKDFTFPGGPVMHDTDSADPYFTESGQLPTKGEGPNILYKKLQNSTGTTAGGVYQGIDGIRRYVKFYDDPVKSMGEVLANNLYHDLGIEAPESQYFDAGSGKTAFASVMKDNVKELADVVDDNTGNPISDEQKGDICRAILKGFATDCLIGNWDVVGVNEGYMRNIVVDDQLTPIRIDNGSAFLCRGLEGRKPDTVLNKLDEYEFFQKKNPSYAAVVNMAFLSTPEFEAGIVDQVGNILALHNKVGGWDKYIDDKVPDLIGQDREKVLAMLYHRTKLLLERAQQISKSSSH